MIFIIYFVDIINNIIVAVADGWEDMGIIKITYYATLAIYVFVILFLVTIITWLGSYIQVITIVKDIS